MTVLDSGVGHQRMTLNPARVFTAVAIDRPRRTLLWVLGLIWLLDAALQYQPYMFGPGLARDVIGPTAQGNPGWVASPVNWTARLVDGHDTLWNTAFATIQLVIALGLFSRRTVRPALALSFGWAVGLWWLGEGLGGVLTGPVLPADGLPGAAVIYALLALLLWPRSSSGQAPSTAESGALPRTAAQVVWLLFWASFVFESLRPADRAPGALHDLVAGGADGEPGWIRAIDRWGASVLAGRGLGVSIALAVAFFLIAVLGIAPAGRLTPLRRVVLLVAVVVGLLFWVFAQDFGEIATGTATDPNSGPLLALLALSFWPARARRGLPARG